MQRDTSVSTQHRLVPALLALLALVAALPGCASVSDFDVKRSIAEQRVSGSPLAGILDDLFAVPIPIDVDIASETAARDTGPATSSHLRQLELRITPTAEGASDSDDFGFLDSVNVFIESTRQNSSLPRTQIAEAVNIAPSRVLPFEVASSVDVLPYADEGSRFVSEVKGSVPRDDVSFDGSFTLRVEVF